MGARVAASGDGARKQRLPFARAAHFREAELRSRDRKRREEEKARTNAKRIQIEQGRPSNALQEEEADGEIPPKYEPFVPPGNTGPEPSTASGSNGPKPKTEGVEPPPEATHNEEPPIWQWRKLKGHWTHSDK